MDSKATLHRLLRQVMGGTVGSKRDLIISAALRRFRSSGVGGTTLHDVAGAAGVPLGNLYYYFKTREALVLAALDACEEELRSLLARLTPLTGASWLGAYFEWLLADPRAAAELGCPFGTLATELRALNDPAAGRAAQIVRTYREAVRGAVKVHGLSAEAGDDVFMAVQGAYVVSRVSGEAALFEHSMQRLRKRLLGDA